MKKLSNLFIIFAMASVAFLSSCGNDDEPVPGPTLNFVDQGADYITANTDVLAGESVKVAWVAAKGDKDLKNFAVTVDGNPFSGYNSGATFSIPAAKQASYQDSVTISIPANAVAGQQYKYTFTVTANDDQTASKTITLTVVANQGAAINTYSAKLLGGQSSATGSFMDADAGTVYSQADAKTNQTAVDLVYYYGATNLATIAALDNSDAASIYNNATTGLQTWTTKNATRFKKTTLTATEFGNISGDAEIITQNASGVTNSAATQLAANEVYAFTTAAGKKGLFLVNSISTGASGSINITVKIQQ